jgi:glycosyltransferase involved in cell wall biosynthesis
MRYLWDLYPAYLHEWTHSKWKRLLMPPFASYLRLWDFASAARVDSFVANSANVQRRIMKTYRRDSEVVHPPVAIDSFYSKPAKDYFLVASELVAYKRIDTAVRVFARTGRRLRVVGDGPEFRALRRMSKPNVEFCGRVSDRELRELYARCRAFLLPGEEDFGLTPVEALASGKPVIALGRGGALETVPTADPLGGILYDEPNEESLAAAIERFERIEAQIKPAALQASVARFAESEFLRKMGSILGPTTSATMGV